MRGHFSIGREESPRVSPKMSRRERTSSSRHPLRNKRLHAETSNERAVAAEPFRQGTSPSVAECLRAVFAAFLWHEGVVHDAMACASYLKFNPDLRKSTTKRAPATTVPLTKEQKARFRHSVEVTSPSLLHLQQLEMLPSGEPLNENIKSKWALPAVTKGAAGQTQEEVASDLPRALRYLVLLWDQVTGACKQAIEEQLVLPSLFAGSKTFHRLERTFTRGSEQRRTKKKREYRSSVVNPRGAALFGSPVAGEMVCELCGLLCSHPVTYHMRQAHPGCGDHAGGKGYNSAGLFCGGWAGNCGDGGVASSSWYLVCDRCREKFLHQAGGHRRTSTSGRRGTLSATAAAAAMKMLSPAQDDVHHNMKSNAMFLLELSSSGLRSRHTNLPSLSEQDALMPSNPFAATGSIQYFNTLGAVVNGPTFGEDFLLPEPGPLGAVVVEADMESTAALNGNETADDNFAAERCDEAGPCPAVSAREGGRVFHRSVSVGLTHLDWTERDLAEMAMQDTRTAVIPRKRNNSSGNEGEYKFTMRIIFA